MPTYLIKRDTRLAHTGQLLLAGETHEITWPKGAEPEQLGPNMELVKSGADGDRKRRSEEQERQVTGSSRRVDAGASDNGTSQDTSDPLKVPPHVADRLPLNNADPRLTEDNNATRGKSAAKAKGD